MRLWARSLKSSNAGLSIESKSHLRVGLAIVCSVTQISVTFNIRGVDSLGGHKSRYECVKKVVAACNVAYDL